jgi:uncharacterized protein YbbC (DUF1343 family)
VEGTNLSEGRGTPLPFHLVGAPWIDGQALAADLNRQDLPGVRFRPVTFRPNADKWADQDCGGVQLHVIDPREFRPVTAALFLLATVQALYPGQLEFRSSLRDDQHFYIDLLAGTPRVRKALSAGIKPTELVASWKDGLDEFARRTRAYHAYT